MIKKILFVIALLIFINGVCFAEILSKKEIKKLHGEIESILSAYEKGNISNFLSKSHRSILKLVGNKEEFEKLLNASIRQFKEDGIVFVEARLRDPHRLYSAGNEEVCFVPRVSFWTVQEKKGTSVGFMIAIRKKGGSQWTYLDGSGLRKDQSILWRLLPELEHDILLPPNYTIFGQ